MKNNKQNSSDSSSMTDLERKELKMRIFSSVKRQKRKVKERIYYVAAAASITLFLVSGWFLLKNNEPTLSDFVKTIDKVEINEANGVTLILGEGENISITEDNSVISYSTSGEEIDLGNSKMVDQKVKDDKKTLFNTLIVPYGKRSKVTLSDGSKVWINSGSRFVYPAAFKGDKREVFLEGEAIFEVAHNKEKPFKVLSDNQEIQVLGTVFNVSNYPDDNRAFTVLKSGSVEVSYKASDSKTFSDKVKITPGTLADFQKQRNEMSTKKVNVDEYFSWREGVLIFRNDSLSTIMRRLSRYYNVHIEIDQAPLSEDTFSGYLDLKDDIGKVLETIGRTTEMDYQISNNDKISITAKNNDSMK